MKSFFSAMVAVLLVLVAFDVRASPEVQAETGRLIRVFEQRFRTEGRGYFRAETDLHRWMLTTRDVALEARRARAQAGLAVASQAKLMEAIERHCQIVSPACVAAVLVMTAK